MAKQGISIFFFMLHDLRIGMGDVLVLEVVVVLDGDHASSEHGVGVVDPVGGFDAIAEVDALVFDEEVIDVVMAEVHAFGGAFLGDHIEESGIVVGVAGLFAEFATVEVGRRILGGLFPSVADFGKWDMVEHQGIDEVAAVLGLGVVHEVGIPLDLVGFEKVIAHVEAIGETEIVTVAIHDDELLEDLLAFHQVDGEVRVALDIVVLDILEEAIGTIVVEHVGHPIHGEVALLIVVAPSDGPLDVVLVDVIEEFKRGVFGSEGEDVAGDDDEIWMRFVDGQVHEVVMDLGVVLVAEVDVGQLEDAEIILVVDRCRDILPDLMMDMMIE